MIFSECIGKNWSCKILQERVKYYEKQMGVPSYSISVRNMTSRYGSNSKRTKHINIAFSMIHYSIPIIDSVLVHELAHIKVFNHSKAFYDVVYAYCPEYKTLKAKLRKGEFKWSKRLPVKTMLGSNLQPL